MDVPKIIWQTHNYEFKDLPDNFKKITQNWKNLNPGWDYRYVSHNQRIEAVKPYETLFNYYIKQWPMLQADVWRYIVTYEHGGVYADMDSVCIKPLDYLLENTPDCDILIVPAINKDHPINNANYAVKAQSQIMKNILKSGQNHIKRAVLDPPKHTWGWFVDEVAKSKNVCYGFTSAIHSKDFKTKFLSNFTIDDYGTKIQYEDFLKKYNLTII